MTFVESIKSCYKNRFNFHGRACRSEFWGFFLMQMGFFFVCLVTFGIMYDHGADENATTFVAALAFLFPLACLLTDLAAYVRRLHDRGHSFWFTLWILIPYIGILIVLITLLRRGDKGENEYGPDPLGSAGE